MALVASSCSANDEGDPVASARASPRGPSANDPFASVGTKPETDAIRVLEVGKPAPVLLASASLWGGRKRTNTLAEDLGESLRSGWWRRVWLAIELHHGEHVLYPVIELVSSMSRAGLVALALRSRR